MKSLLITSRTPGTTMTKRPSSKLILTPFDACFMSLSCFLPLESPSYFGQCVTEPLKAQFNLPVAWKRKNKSQELWSPPCLFLFAFTSDHLQMEEGNQITNDSLTLQFQSTSAITSQIPTQFSIPGTVLSKDAYTNIFPIRRVYLPM